MSKKKSYYIFGFIFLIFSFYTVYQLRNNFYGNYIYFIMILIICVFSDIGGYIFGKIFKGPKLTKFSPNKTYSGMIGSYLFAIIATSLFFNNLDFFKNIDIQATSKEITLVFLIFVLFVFGFVLFDVALACKFNRLALPITAFLVVSPKILAIWLAV